MNPAPPVTSTRIRGRLPLDPFEALAESFAPVRQGRCPSLRPEDRVRRAGRPRAELLAREPADAAREAGRPEDRLGEVGARALAVRGGVVDGERQAHDL